MKFTINLNLKILTYLLIAGGIAWALSAYVITQVAEGGFGLYATLVMFGLVMSWAGTRLQGYFDDRIIRHYWLTQGYSKEAADKKVVEFGETARDSIRAGTFFKEYD